MIEVTGLTKSFGDIVALKDMTATIQKGSVYGLIGTNGAGKSTFLRLIAGVLKPDAGAALIDGEPLFENLGIKRRCFYISDEQHFLPSATPLDMMQYYRHYYPLFSRERFVQLLDRFGLEKMRRIRTFSKGMKKQVSVILALSSFADYIFCDETFDGLDPMVRQAVKGLFAAEVAGRGLTPIIASHNLREIEDICDHVGLLHGGGILLNRDLDELKLGIHKVQVLLKDPLADLIPSRLDVMKTEARGSLLTLVIRGDKGEIEAAITSLRPIFYEFLPLSLEEIFINETEVAGYDIQKILF